LLNDIVLGKIDTFIKMINNDGVPVPEPLSTARILDDDDD